MEVEEKVTPEVAEVAKALAEATEAVTENVRRMNQTMER